MKNTDIKRFVTDLDGTLLSRFSKLSGRAAEALRKLKQKGIAVVICTGRPFYSVKRIIPEELYDYAICMNGQDIYLPEGKRHIHQPFLHQDQIIWLLSFLDRYPVMAEATVDESSHYYISKKFLFLRRGIDMIKSVIYRLRHTRSEQLVLHTDYSDLPHHRLGKICFAGLHLTLLQIADQIPRDTYSVTFVNKRWIEVQTANISKGIALRKVMFLAGVRPEETAAIGDGENDIPMLKEAGYAIAMKNAMGNVKKEADETAGFCFDEGVAEWIEKNLL
jgi:Cof subfamily protein (haloacid dehalogenase superfamily)